MAIQKLAHPPTLTLPFTPSEKRLVESAARICNLSLAKYSKNTLLGSAEAIVEGERRARRSAKRVMPTRGMR